VLYVPPASCQPLCITGVLAGPSPRYKPERSLFAYLGAILGFAAHFLLNSHFVAPHLTWDEAIVLSMSSFHGRGFFNPSITLGDTYAQLAALEDFVGLVIEVSFIATFTQRFFGR
jgi:hypothetical protein